MNFSYLPSEFPVRALASERLLRIDTNYSRVETINAPMVKLGVVFLKRIN